MSEQFSIPTPGDIVAGKYHVVEELGRGAYGVVFLAQQPELHRTVALKTLLPQAFLQADIVQRFQREAQLISRLDHPNVIKLYDYGVDEGLLYMAVEYVEGKTLQDVLNEEAPLALRRVKSIAIQILGALTHAHEEGIVHRDLKPENIVLLPVRHPDGRTEEVVKVLDFGISKLVQGEKDSGALKTLTQSGTVLGTPHYMSPENIIGDEVDHTADLYAIGILLYEMLVGEHPFDAPSPSAVMVRHLRDDPPDLPPGLRNSAFGDAIHRSLIKQPLERVQSADELARILSRAPNEIADEVDTAHAIGDPDDESSSPVALAVAVGIIVLVLVVSIGWKLWLTQEELTRESLVVEPDASVTAVAEVDAGAVEAEERGEAEESDELSFDFDDAVDFDPPGKEPDEDSGADSGDEPGGEPGEESGEETAASAAKDRGPTEKKASDKPRDRPKAKSVEFTIESDPVNASVTIDGRKVGSTPMSVDVPFTEEVVEVRFSHIGYKNESLRVAPNEDRVLKVTMQKDRLKFID